MRNAVIHDEETQKWITYNARAERCPVWREFNITEIPRKTKYHELGEELQSCPVKGEHIKYYLHSRKSVCRQMGEGMQDRPMKRVYIQCRLYAKRSAFHQLGEGIQSRPLRR